MRYLKVAVGAATLCLLLFAAGSALAASPAWELCKELGEKEGVFEDNKCTKEAASGNFEWLELAEKAAFTSTGTLKFRDKKAEKEVECSTSVEGKIGPENKGEITKATINECKSLKNCTGAITAEARHLPWKTELVEQGESLENAIRGAGSGEPGWKVTCGAASDECTGETTNTFVTNNEAGTVSLAFKKTESGTETCTTGGKEAGEVEGTETLKAAQPARARAVEFVWKVKSAIPGRGAVQMGNTETKELKKMEAHNTALKLEGSEGGKTYKAECPEILLEGTIKGGRAGTGKVTLVLKKCLNIGAAQCKITANSNITSNNLSLEVVAGINGTNGNSAGKDLLLLLPETVGQSFFTAFALEGAGCPATATVKGTVLFEVENAAALVKVMKIKGEPLEFAGYRNSSGVSHTAGLTNNRLLGKTEFKLEGEPEFGVY